MLLVRMKNRVMEFFTNPYSVIFGISLVLLVFLIVVPLWEILKESMQLSVSDAKREGPGGNTGFRTHGGYPCL